MKAAVITVLGEPEVLQVQQVEDPELKDGEVLIKIEAAGLNKHDPGLECSGTIEAVGGHVSRWKVGDQVCALVNGGGYAEKVAVPEGQVLPVRTGSSGSTWYFFEGCCKLSGGGVHRLVHYFYD